MKNACIKDMNRINIYINCKHCCTTHLSYHILSDNVQDKLKEGYLKDLKVKLQQFEKFIADRKFFASDEVCINKI